METSILIPEEFRDRWFSKSFGAEIQEKIRCAGKSISLDFSKCEWVDPIPALALLCHLKQWADREKDTDLSVKLGLASTLPDDKTIRPRLFLSKHGFLRAMANACPNATFKYDSAIEDFPKEFKASTLDRLDLAITQSANQRTLLYGTEPICPPMLFSSGGEANATADFVDKAIKTMDAKLFRGRASEFPQRDSTLVRVRQVVTEIVTNAAEHAYEGCSPGPIALYARLRRHNDHLGECETANDCPAIDHLQNVTSGRYLELFICDIGHGLFHHVDDWETHGSDEVKKQVMKARNRDGKHFPQPLLALICRHPVSRHPRNNSDSTSYRSNVTGLSHVNTVLRIRTDRSRVFVSPAWTAGPHPRPHDYNGGSTDKHFTSVVPERYGIAPDGSFFQFAITISHADLPISGWLAPLPSTVAGPPWHQPQDAFRDGDDLGVHPLPSVFDLADRLANSRTPQERSQTAIVSAFDEYLTGQGDVAVIRLSRDFRKNLTDAIVSRWLQHCSECLPFSPARTLAFCDLSRAQGVLLAEHLETVLHRKKEHPNIEQLVEPPFILILTEDLLSRVLVLGNDQTNNYFEFASGGLPERALLLRLIRTLRHFDSDRFWKAVSKLKTDLLLPDVRWSTDNNGSEIILRHYLDYSLAVQDRDLAKTVRRALRRLLAAFPDHRHIAIDDLIEPDLADAARWMQKPSKTEGVPNLFVISSVVTGSTVEREARHRGAPSAVAACFLVPSSPATHKDESRFQYYSSLEWIPAWKKTQIDDHEWEREPGTPFVRPVVRKIEVGANEPSRSYLIQPLARNLVDRGNDDSKPPSAAESYEEWHREQLLKTGHWIFGRRHGLLEINHLGTFQMFADSAKGFYEWLLHELQTLTTNTHRPILIYSPGRLNAVMVRHLFKMTDAEGFSRLNRNDTWQIVPINFLPDIGDGLKRLTQITSAHIKKCKGVVGGTVFFLDVGYVGNRTFRHTRRQILALGAKEVIGFGLLNRTSSPALPGEMERAEVKCYWRMDVPSLDDQRSCPICRSLTAMVGLQERIGQLRSVDSPCVKRIFDDWEPADPNEAWEDFGLPPIELTKPLQRSFGFDSSKKEDQSNPKAPVTPIAGQQSLWTETGEPTVPRPQLPPPTVWLSKDVTWKHVWLRDSAQAVTYAIEIARTQSKPEYPLRLVKELAEPGGVPSPAFADISAAVEVLSCYLLLCAHEIGDGLKEALGVHLLQYLVRLEDMPPPESAPFSPRHARLRELAALAFINLDANTKRLLQDVILSIMEKTLLLNPETRVAIMAVLMASSGDGSPNQPGASFDQKATSRLQEKDFRDTPAANILRFNYWGLTLNEQPLKKQFDDALHFFGPGDRHDEYICLLKCAENNVDQSAGWRLCRTVFQIAHTLIFRSDRFGKDSVAPANQPGELWRALCGSELNDMKRVEMRIGEEQPPDKYQEAVREVTDLIQAMRKTFHRAMLRFDPDQGCAQFDELVRTTQWLADTAIPDEQSKSQLRFKCSVSNFALSTGNRYLLLGEELKTQIGRLAKEAIENAREDQVAPPEQFGGSNEFARLWIGVFADQTGKVAVEFWNQGKDSTRADDFKRHQADLAPVHQQLRTSITRDVSQADEDHFWFSTKIEFRWIQGGGS